ncbi:uncharacterized protein IWZ02DRAFT_181883 [Phyllosticta citriasiana]|uniref:uncharacterized protein n=1 Tax=Phyllosticta citriasiana TaxID=595635 RepID=UPI0030FDF0AA
MRIDWFGVQTSADLLFFFFFFFHQLVVSRENVSLYSIDFRVPSRECRDLPDPFRRAQQFVNMLVDRRVGRRLRTRRDEIFEDCDEMATVESRPCCVHPCSRFTASAKARRVWKCEAHLKTEGGRGRMEREWLGLEIYLQLVTEAFPTSLHPLWLTQVASDCILSPCQEAAELVVGLTTLRITDATGPAHRDLEVEVTTASQTNLQHAPIIPPVHTISLNRHQSLSTLARSLAPFFPHTIAIAQTCRRATQAPVLVRAHVRPTRTTLAKLRRISTGTTPLRLNPSFVDTLSVKDPTRVTSVAQIDGTL